MDNTIPSPQPPSRAIHPTWDDVRTEAELTDGELTDLELRIIALERALVSRRARRRMRRQVRKSARVFAWAGPSFAARRIEAITNDVLANGPLWKRLNRDARQESAA